MPLNPTGLYQDLISVQSEVAERLRTGGYDKNFSLWIFLDSRQYSKGEIKLKLWDGDFSSGVAVEGKDIWAVVDEFLHRKGFEQAQATLQIGPPSIDQ